MDESFQQVQDVDNAVHWVGMLYTNHVQVSRLAAAWLRHAVEHAQVSQEHLTQSMVGAVGGREGV